jgi:hypothetical protein
MPKSVVPDRDTGRAAFDPVRIEWVRFWGER